MKSSIYIFILAVFNLTSCSFDKSKITINRVNSEDSILKVNMDLSAFGVESDGYPNIDATLNFKDQGSICKVSYYDPKYKSKIYSLTPKEMDFVFELLQNVDLKKLKKEYTTEMPDQPTSIITINTLSEKFVIKDYGLNGEFPLKQLYKIVYKLDQNFR